MCYNRNLKSRYFLKILVSRCRHPWSPIFAVVCIFVLYKLRLVIFQTEIVAGSYNLLLHLMKPEHLTSIPRRDSNSLTSSLPSAKKDASGFQTSIYLICKVYSCKPVEASPITRRNIAPLPLEAPATAAPL